MISACKRAANRRYYLSHQDERLRKRREYRAEHKEELASYNREYRKKHPEKIREQVRRHVQKYGPDHKKAAKLKKNYGIALSEFNELLSAQGQRCAICETDRWGKPGPVVDHDHVRGTVRGILCHRCNIAIGMIGDDISIAKRIIAYLISRATEPLPNTRERRFKAD